MTHPLAEDIDPVTLTADVAPGDAVVVALGGDLDIASVPAVRERLLGLLRPGGSRLVVDMSAVRYADASGLEALVSTRRRAVLLGGTLRLAALQPEVARVLIASGLSRLPRDLPHGSGRGSRPKAWHSQAPARNRPSGCPRTRAAARAARTRAALAGAGRAGR